MNEPAITGILPELVAAAVAVLFTLVVLLPRMRAAARREALARAEAQALAAIRTSPDPTTASDGSLDLTLQLVGVGVAAFLWSTTGRTGLAIGVFAIWWGIVLVARSRRRQRMELDAEASALEAIGSASRALRAGIPVSGMLAILAAESRGPARRAFGELVRRESLGEQFDSAVRRVLLGSSIAPLRAFGLALLVHGDAGGNLADSTDRLARSLVERGRVRRRARTITSYARTAGMTLSVMPIAVIALMTAMVDGYAEFVFERPLGNLLVGLSAVLVVVGIVSMQRIARVDETSEGAAR